MKGIDSACKSSRSSLTDTCVWQILFYSYIPRHRLFGPVFTLLLMIPVISWREKRIRSLETILSWSPLSRFHARCCTITMLDCLQNAYVTVDTYFLDRNLIPSVIGLFMIQGVSLLHWTTSVAPVFNTKRAWCEGPEPIQKNELFYVVCYCFSSTEIRL